MNLTDEKLPIHIISGFATGPTFKYFSGLVNRRKEELDTFMKGYE